MPPQRLLVIEFVTGGGLAGLPLPEPLAQEGGLMLSALLRELRAIPGIALWTTRDHRLPPLPAPINAITLGPFDDPYAVWGALMLEADAVWPIAPETGGALERLSRLVLDQGRRLIGSSPEAIAQTASKRRTAEVLGSAGIPVIPTYPARQGFPDSPSGWVLKPDDGAGCTDTFFSDDRRVLEGIARNYPQDGPIVQPYVAGTAASLSLLCRDGRTLVLACNEQRITREAERLCFGGVWVNGLSRETEALAPLAQAIARALPGLAGFVGVDLILAPAGPMVVEVNPRLTTAYVGLSEALDMNVAAAVLEVFDQGLEAIPRPRVNTTVAVMTHP
jgi:predicted ATP-grasp superfamily ATP-dependent carboligase